MNLIVGKLYTTIAKILIIFNILYKELIKPTKLKYLVRFTSDFKNV